eukprot:5989693-Prorocentrum_lima.AAC.1
MSPAPSDQLANLGRARSPSLYDSSYPEPSAAGSLGPPFWRAWRDRASTPRWLPWILVTPGGDRKGRT